MVGHTVYLFAQTALLVNVHFNESMSFEAPGFCYSNSTGSSLGCLADSLLLPRVTEILQLWFCRTGSFFLQQFMDRVDAEVGQLKALDLGLGW